MEDNPQSRSSPQKGSLEVEIPEPLRERTDSEASVAGKKEKFAMELRERQARWDETTRAMQENLDARPDLSAMAWKSFLTLGALSAVYFVSLAFTDKVNFRDGASILWQAAGQLAGTALVWGVCLWAYRESSPAGQRRVERALRFSFVTFVMLAAMALLGLFHRQGRAMWASGAFLFSLGFQVAAAVFLYRLKRRLSDRIEYGPEVRAWTRPLMHLSEGLIGYATLGIFLQAVVFINVPSIWAAVLRDPKALLLFCVPLMGYLLLRKLVEV